MKRVFVYIILSIIYAGVCLLSGAINWYFQATVVSLSTALLTLLLFKWYGKSIDKFIYIFAPFYLLYSISSIYLKSYYTYPIWIGGIVTFLFSYFYLIKKQKILPWVGIVLFITISNLFYVTPNYYGYLDSNKIKVLHKLENISLYDSLFHKIDINNFKGKIVLLEIWHTSCVPCIKNFPELEKLAKKYSSNSNVLIYSLNIPLPTKGNKEKAIELTNRFSFQKLYFKEMSDVEGLNINVVPTALIYDKKLNCRYSGMLNNSDNIWINNANSIINELIEEK
jgi:thiol-disulfide isomerase/thioredoxin